MTIDKFKTALGIVELDISIATEFPVDLAETTFSKIIKTINHTIEIIVFDNISDWTKETDFPVEKTKGWIVRINKVTDNVEEIEITCGLKKADLKIISSADSGEYLDAIWIESETHVLSIGTEDGEMLKYRSENNDYMPYRFKKELGYQSKSYSFTNYLDLGFKTVVPRLNKNEKIYFQYLLATNPLKKSKDYPNEDDISTNFAVDFPKRTLIQRLSIPE